MQKYTQVNDMKNVACRLVASSVYALSIVECVSNVNSADGWVFHLEHLIIIIR